MIGKEVSHSGPSESPTVDRLENALAAVGCPDKPCPRCGTNAHSVAVLTAEVLPQVLEANESNGAEPFVSVPATQGSLPSVLDEARGLVDGERQEDYGDPVECMGNWAEILRILYGWDIDAHKASVAMSLLKHVREAHRPKRDNRVDAPAYMHIADLAHERLHGR